MRHVLIRRLLRVACVGVAAVAVGTWLRAQDIGTVHSQTARVQGMVAVSAGTTTIQNNATVTAGREATDVDLLRGGKVRVCVGSTVGISQATTGSAKPRAMLFALQKGATEITTAMSGSDAVVTPDLRIESSDAAPLDLHLRVNEAGDTCVENLGRNAPMLHVTEQLSGAGYLVKPGQHIVFERGSVRAVVNRATTQCGCPRANKPGDDFPEAVSAGLVQPSVPQSQPGETHTQVSTALDYNGATGTVSGPPNPDGTVPTTTAASTQSAAKPVGAAKDEESSGNPFRAIGRFFRRLFGGK